MVACERGANNDAVTLQLREAFQVCGAMVGVGTGVLMDGWCGERHRRWGKEEGGRRRGGKGEAERAERCDDVRRAQWHGMDEEPCRKSHKVISNRAHAPFSWCPFRKMASQNGHTGDGNRRRVALPVP
eukprot:213480-Chlamydomonas_euryale.AAC.5